VKCVMEGIVMNAEPMVRGCVASGKVRQRNYLLFAHSETLFNASGTKSMHAL